MTEQLSVSRGAHEDSSRLPRRLGAVALAFIFFAFNAPLAALAGFLQPAIAFGNGLGAPVAFIAAGALLLVFQIGCLAMSRKMKSPGPFYCYVAEGLGKGPALAGSILAAIAYILFAVSGYIFLGLVTVSMLDQLVGNHFLPWQVWGIIGFAIVTVLNLLRIDLSARVIAVCVIIEMVFVVLYQFAVMGKGGPEGYAPEVFTLSEFFSGNPALAILFALNTMIGIEAMAVYREEVIDPNRTVPRAAYSAIGFIAVFYAFAAYAYIVAVGPSNVIYEARNAPVESVLGTFQSYIGGFVSTLVAVFLVTSQLTASNSVQGSSIRYLYSFGHDRILPKALGRVHHRLGSPHIAVAASIVVCLVIYLTMIIFSDDVVLLYGALGGFGILSLLPLLLTTCIAVIVFFRRNPGTESIWKTLVSPTAALIGFALVIVFAFLHLDLMVGNKLVGIAFASTLLVLIAAGILGAQWLKRHRPEAYRRLGRQADDLD